MRRLVDFEENMKLVPFTINKYFPELSFDEDAMQVGYLALWKACQGYKPGKGAFATYAVRAIKNRMMNYLQESVYKPHPAAFFSMDARDQSFRDKYNCEEDSSLVEIEIEEELAQIVNDFRASLARWPRQLEVFNVLLTGVNLRQAAERLGCSHQNVDRTRKVLKRKFLKYLNKRARRETL